MNSEEHCGSLGKAVVAALTCNASTLKSGHSEAGGFLGA